MRASLAVLLLALSPLALADSSPTKPAALHRLLQLLGTDYAEDTPQFMTYDNALTEGDIEKAIAFFESSAGSRLLSASKEAAHIALSDLDAAVARAKEKRSLADLRTLAVCAEAFQIDNDAYPIAGTLDELQNLVQPTYVHTMPRLDGWGHEYVYIGSLKSYRIISAGPDGTISPDSRKPGLKKGDFGDDLVFADGELVSSP